MNLLAKKREVSWLLVAGFVLLVWGCKEDLGIELPPDVQRTEVKVVEITLPVTTVYFDSLRTDKEGKLISGQYSDSFYGSLVTKGFTEIEYKSGKYPEEDFILIEKTDFTDSIAEFQFLGAKLVLDIARVLTDDNFLNHSVELYELTEFIYTQGIYLSNRSIPEGELIGSGNIILSDLSNTKFDSAKAIRDSIDFTSEFSNKLLLDYGTNGSDINRYGFSIQSIVSNGLVAFDLDSTEVQLLMQGKIYNSETKVFKKDTIISVGNFRLSPNNHFTQVLRDRTGSAISSLTNGQEVDLDPNYSYFNELSGLHTRIDLSPFFEFVETEEDVLFNRVNMTIDVVPSTANQPVMPAASYYFSKSTNPININWPGSVRYPAFFKTILQQDNRYLTLQSSNIFNIVQPIETLEENPLRIGYSGSATIFWQFLYDNITNDLNDVKVEKRSPMLQLLNGINDMIMVNGDDLSIGRSIIPKDGVKLRMYYTKPKE